MHVSVRSVGLLQDKGRWDVFAGWQLSRGNLLILDYEAARNRAHLYWSPEVIHQEEMFLPLRERVCAAMLDMSDPDVELQKSVSSR